MINKYDYKNLTPFKWCVIQNFPFIEEDFDAITNYQLLCKVVEYLNNTINATNELGEEVEDISSNFIELKNYVDNYFNNLDVQDEVNNKLDEMVQNGTFDNLINKYISSHILNVFNNVEELKNANLNNGTFAKTMGYYNSSDLGGGNYIISNEQLQSDNGSIIQLNNGLFAILIEKNINVKQFGAYGDNIHDDSEAIQKANNYLLNLIKKNNTWSLSKINLYFPAGQYKITKTIVLSPFLRFIANGLVSFMNYSTTNCIILKNNIDDPGYNTTFPYRNGVQGNIFDGAGSFQIIDFSNSENSIGLELSINLNEYNQLTENAKPYKSISMTNFNNITIYNFNIGLKINPINFYINSFYNFKLINNYYGIVITENGINSGENISFNECSISSSEIGIYSKANGFNMTFNNCSFDFNHQRIAIFDKSSLIILNNCHIEHNENKNISKNYGLFFFNNTSGINNFYINNCYIYSQSTQLLPLISSIKENNVRVSINNLQDSVASNNAFTKEDFNLFLCNAPIIALNGFFSTYRLPDISHLKNFDPTFSGENIGNITDLKYYNLTGQNIEIKEIIEEDNEKIIRITGNTDLSQPYFTVFLETKNFIPIENINLPIRANILTRITAGNITKNITTEFFDINQNLITSKTAYGSNSNVLNSFQKLEQNIGSGIPTNAKYVKLKWFLQIFADGNVVYIKLPSAY